MEVFMFLSFLVVIFILVFVFSLLFLGETCIFISILKRRSAAGNDVSKRLFMYRRQRRVMIIVSVVSFVAILVVGFIGVSI